MVAGWDPPSYPLPPPNPTATSMFLPGVVNLQWGDPTILAGNTPLHVVGVNVYRSDSSDRGPFYRINEFPIGSGFYQDYTDVRRVEREKVTDWVFRGDGPNNRQFRFRTKHPAVKKTSVYANHPSDVTVWVDGVEAKVDEVFGRTGEVTLVNQPAFDVVTEQMIPATLPDKDSLVEVSYWKLHNAIVSGLDRFTWYRLSTVVFDESTPSWYRETPLNRCVAVSTAEVESLDYIWEEAVRRNQWILQQGGERVKVFIRKHCGVPCTCGRGDIRALEFSQQPVNNCLDCYGTGIVQGYDGPFECIVAPDDGERRIAQTPMGRRKEHTYEVWTGPSPLITQRDFLVKLTNERFSVGAVRRPTNRGNILQQHFTIGYLDEGEIRYRVPIDGTTNLPWPETRPEKPAPIYPRMPVTGEPSLDEREGWAGPAYPEGADLVTHPLQTEKATVPESTEKRGRTRVWENINY